MGVIGRGKEALLVDLLLYSRLEDSPGGVGLRWGEGNAGRVGEPSSLMTGLPSSSRLPVAWSRSRAERVLELRWEVVARLVASDAWSDGAAAGSSSSMRMDERESVLAQVLALELLVRERRSDQVSAEMGLRGSRSRGRKG